MSARSEEPYLHFRAPRRHGETLCLPDPRELPGLLSANQEALAHSDSPINGLEFSELRQLYRQEIAAKLGNNTPNLWIVSGHQPELFHPGVWLKNFALSAFAQQTGAKALNVVVDQDLCNQVGIKIPVKGLGNQLELQTVAWDAAALGVPWENHFVHDRKKFESVATTARKHLLECGVDPLVTKLWDFALPLLDQHWSAGDIFATARHQLEKQHGLNTSEIPIRHVVNTTAFRMLLLHLVRNRHSLYQIYNSALAHYRQAHRIRSTAHPVPDLKKAENETEIPLWVYSRANPRRRAIFAGSSSSTRWLTDRQEFIFQWSTHDSDESVMKSLADLESRDIKLRPRALLTTMVLRLFLADWFVHGIGGGKYDQLNDHIIRAFFDIRPPSFSVISGTLYLPLFTENHESPSHVARSTDDTCGQQFAQAQRARQQWLEAKQMPRRFRYHAEDFATAPADIVPTLVAEKNDLLAAIPPPGHRKQWHIQLENVRKRIVSSSPDMAGEFAGRINSSLRQVQDAKILTSREFSFALYPESWLITRLKELGQACWEISPKTTVHTVSQSSSR